MRRYRDGGFTLVELLVATTMVGIVGTAVSAVAIMGSRTVGSSKQGYEQSAVSSTLGSRIRDDVQAASAMGLSDAVECVGPSGSARVLWLVIPAVSDPATTVAYDERPGVLSRTECAPTGPPTTATLAEWPAEAGTVDVRCDIDPCGAYTTVVGLTGSQLVVADGRALPTSFPFSVVVGSVGSDATTAIMSVSASAPNPDSTWTLSIDPTPATTPDVGAPVRYPPRRVDIDVPVGVDRDGHPVTATIVAARRAS